MNDAFNLFAQSQSASHCGPCSLSYCLCLLGIDATQRELAIASGASLYTQYRLGLDEQELRRAAVRYRAKAAFLSVRDRDRGMDFIRRLKRHLSRGLPAVLSNEDFSHWVSVLGLFEGKFIVRDPNDDDVEFHLWSEKRMIGESWNDNGEEAPDEPPQYFAILVSRRDRRPPRWRLTREFIQLTKRGSGDFAAEMTENLVEIARRSTPNGSLSDRPLRLTGNPLTGILRSLEKALSDNVCHWVDLRETEAGEADIRRQFRDYTVVAEAAGLCVPADLDRTIFAIQLASLLTTFAWNGEL